MKLMQTALAGVIGALVADLRASSRYHRRGQHLRSTDLYEVGRRLPEDRRRQGQLSGHRLIGRHQADHREDGRFRRFGRAAEGRRTREARAFPVPDGGRRRRAGDQRAGREGRLNVTLSGEVLGDIYLGKIKKWNDPAIVALNPKVKLPDTDIAVVRRADGSGTSFIWTNYLSKVNAEWKSKVGEGSTVNWPTGTGGKGNDGVAAFVQRLPGAIGYVEWAYAKQNKMTYVDLKNCGGHGGRAEDGDVQGRGCWRRLVEVVLPDPDERAGQGRMAGRRRDLRAAAHDAGQGRRKAPKR